MFRLAIRVVPVTAVFCAMSLVVLSGCKTTGESTEATQSELHNGPGGERILPQMYNLQSRMKWLSKVSYKSIDDVPALPSEGCEMLNFLVEIPVTKGDVGHSGIAIGRDYYDFGPKAGYRKVEIDLDWTQIQTPMAYAEGYPWWDTVDRSYGEGKLWGPEFQTSDDISLLSVINNLPKLAHNQTVMLIPMEVPIDHANRIRSWWKKIYADFPEYKIPGLHCTSTVIRSFEETENESEGRWDRINGGDVWTPDTISPTMWATKLLDDQALSWNAALNYRHRCGPNKGKVLRAAVIRVGDDIKPEGGDSLLLDPVKMQEKLSGLSSGN